MNLAGEPAGSCILHPSHPRKGCLGNGSRPPAPLGPQPGDVGDLRIREAPARVRRREGVLRSERTLTEQAQRPVRSPAPYSLDRKKVFSASLGTFLCFPHTATGWQCWMTLEFQVTRSPTELRVWRGWETTGSLPVSPPGLPSCP